MITQEQAKALYQTRLAYAESVANLYSNSVPELVATPARFAVTVFAWEKPRGGVVQ